MSQNPKDQLLESLSALVDNEASELEVRRLLKQSDNQSELGDRWHRYQLIGSLMRKEDSVVTAEGSNFLAGLHDKLGFDDVHSRPGSTAEVSAQSNEDNTHLSEKVKQTQPVKVKPIWSLVGKVSIAASFAFAVILSSNLVNQSTGVSSEAGELASLDSVPQQAADPSQSSVASAPRGFVLPNIGSRTVSQTNLQPSSFQVLQRPVSVKQTDDLSDAETQNMLNEMLILHAERASANGGISLLPFARVSKMEQQSY